TGRPKGVVLSHRAAIAFTDWAVRTFSLGAEDRLSNHAPFHFDLSTFDLYGAFAVGASVRLIKPLEAMLAPWLARMIREEGITIWYSVPSVLAAMAQSTPELARAVGPQLRWMLFAGEVFPTPQLRALRDAVPQVRLGNLFGPTETNVCTWYEVCELPEGDAPIPIGKVCDHLTGSIRGEDGREVAPGAVGLLWIAGGNLLSGYWGDADLTRQRMARGSDDRLFYNTGDLVRRSADGTLIFQGRRDHLVKVRGYRVELGEVEAAVHALPEVAEAVVVAVEDAQHGHRLDLHAVLKAPSPDADRELRVGLADRLPAYMIPARIWIRGDLPRTSSGKVDRNRLRAESAASRG
ncbi:MAG: AMP-binding protein, partial [Candidatus Eisenbacteria bacterium]|nr:AMP-binding protein [Candidatus Eisenbacteria bacterium]